ncbi:MAG: Fic family protein [Bacillota bacterium]
MENYQPPITITEKIVNLVAAISQYIGEINFSQAELVNPSLRKNNRIRTVHSSLAIENNSLSLDQVTAIIKGKKVLGLPSEIQEVKNAYEAYDLILTLNPYKIKDLLFAHKIMMKGLVTECGIFRTGSVGIFAGDKLVHLAPPASFVANQMATLLNWAKTSELNMLIKACVFHYECEFIHPFQDGNGRIGRMWHTLLLSKYQPMFAYLPVESIIKARQAEYYKVLAMADSCGNSSIFVEFLLDAILEALKEVADTSNFSDATKKVLDALGNETLSAKELMQRVGLSHMQTFRKNYLNPALQAQIIAMTIVDKPNSRNQKYYKI